MIGLDLLHNNEYIVTTIIDRFDIIYEILTDFQGESIK